MKTIPLSQNLVAIVDDEDYTYLSQWKWSAKKQLNTFYAMRTITKFDGTKTSILMHRVIMKTPRGLECDHVFHNGLDNRKFIEVNGIRKVNLRNCSHAQNQMNSHGRGTSKYLGVSITSFKTKKGIQIRYTAQIGVNRAQYRLGSFKTEERAARAYDKAAKKYFGEFANLNFKENN